MAVSKWDNPEPAMSEPIHAYVALFFSFSPYDAIKVREERRTLMMTVSDLYPESVGQKRVSTGRIYEKTRSTRQLGTRRIATSYFDTVICSKLNSCGAHPLVHGDACLFGVLEEYVVELGSLDLKCSRRPGIECVRKFNRNVPT